MHGHSSEERPRSHPDTRILRFALVLGVIGWVVFVIVRIHLASEPGAASAADLARAYESALNDKDARGLANLLGPPIADDAGDVAKHLIDRPHEGRWHVSVIEANDSTYLAVSDDGQAPVRMMATEDDGRWQVNPLVTG